MKSKPFSHSQADPQTQEPARSLRDLQKVLAVTSKMNSTLNLSELLGIITRTAEEVIKAEASSLMLLEENSRDLIFKVALGEKGGELREKFRVKPGEGIAGWVVQREQSIIVDDVTRDPRFAARFDQATGFRTKAILCVPIRAKGKLIGVLEAMNPVGRKIFSKADLELFETFADQAAISIENAKLHEVLLKQEVAEKELKIARDIQQSFLPDPHRMSLPIEIAAQMTPAYDVGGDFFDILKFDESKIGIVIGDVTGKGVPAALYMVNVVSSCRFLSRQFQDPGTFLNALNQQLLQVRHMGIFSTLLYTVIDLQDGFLRYALAGHFPPVRHYSKTEEIQILDETGGLPLGLFDEATYNTNIVHFDSGDSFLLYTDGVTEARNPARQEYGLARLKKSFSTQHPNPRSYLDRILGEINSFVGEAPAHDDMTLIVFRVP